ncbi:hypothetical protein BAUCODRAFT_181418 [Baudoinia panamericana UAMH 10762]|uniref:Uncharacterized protein n=1 Tax=Baudoinia panamericana (strain UAMH 10762) TaxID=717646 RepID=M2M132_BAUPA|nr:uncharacterized protein BAUCODRAFT_181418 [Baudoinia panamericana UAMH 10762]EMD00743.1 hypothetical protein BAUCODRAFT_181418 [Baudoinia panamericana UAMH 10762]
MQQFEQPNKRRRMAASSESVSPDPITLPSSPLGTRIASSPTKPLAPRSTNVHSSASKSVVLDVDKAGHVSPWRIKVTVEAEPRSGSGSPSKRRIARRTTKVPLKDAPSSSPIRNTRIAVAAAGSEIGHPARRKRKVTPVRSTTRTQPPGEPVTDEDDAALMPPPSLPSSSAAKARRRRSLVEDSVECSQRLSLAREELDRALQDAVGHEGEDAEDGEYHPVPGDMTVAGDEEFTMVSVDTLQSMKADTSVISQRHEGERSTLTASYLPSSPPKLDHEKMPTATVNYPNLSIVVEEARTKASILYDVIDNATGGAEEDPTSKIIQQPNDADIWQEEASRSFEDESETQVLPRSFRRNQQAQPNRVVSQNLNALFAGTSRPPRSKIPRTWRRTSGNDFAYGDSPAHAEGEIAPSKRDASTDGGGSRASSGVMTPPSSEDEANKQQQPEADDHSFSRPDAEATQLQAKGVMECAKKVVSPGARSEIASPCSDSSSSVTSPDGDDTGLFWQSNMPQVYRTDRPRPQRQKALDLSELLSAHKGRDRSTSEEARLAKTAQAASTSARRAQGRASEGKAHSPLHMRPVEGKIKSSPSEAGKARMVSSPLRRSLLRSSKLGGSPVGKVGKPVQPQAAAIRNVGLRSANVQIAGDEVDGEDEIDASLNSKASEQRQLLAEIAAQGVQPHGSEDAYVETSHLAELYPVGGGGGEVEGASGGGSDGDEPSRSYEEHLNLDSPQKIRVKFNDSAVNSSVLRPTKQYQPLFTPVSAEQGKASPPTITLVGKRPEPSTQGFISRLSTNFWSAVIRPSGPTDVLPANDPIYSPSLRAHIRSRYGVLPSTHPWKMVHMRTLHRMHNSCTSNKSDSIIPKSGPLPAHLLRLVGYRIHSVGGSQYDFTTQHAHVVEALMQVLVPRELVEAMKRGEVEVLGDAIAREYRGLIMGRHGDDLVWSPERGVLTGDITAEFVVKALGDVVAFEVGKAMVERQETRK